MNISVICIGKLKEKYWSQAVVEYSKRLSSVAEELAVKQAEGVEILKKIKDNMYVITLEVQGKELSSEKLAGKIEELGLSGNSNIAFVIGGSLGLSPDVSKRADFKLSFSPMTFPHQMMRVILLEQIYRSFKIIRHETYHK